MSDSKVALFYEKNELVPSSIKYITRQENHSCIFLSSGRVLRSFIPVKDLAEPLPPQEFICINKATVIAKSQIGHIDGCTYHMRDGTVFEGRKRTVAAHHQLGEILSDSGTGKRAVMDVQKRFSVLDNMPAAFCVIELVFDAEGHGVDFVFRYCNKEMEVVEGKTINEMVDNSFYKVFPNADKKWLVAYADVAVNGRKRYLHDFSPEINKTLFVRCFQPMEGFCACLLIPEDDRPDLQSSDGLLE